MHTYIHTYIHTYVRTYSHDPDILMACSLTRATTAVFCWLAYIHTHIHTYMQFDESYDSKLSGSDTFGGFEVRYVCVCLYACIHIQQFDSKLVVATPVESLR